MTDKLFGAIDRTVEVAIFVCFLSVVIVGGLQVFNRFFLNYSLSWSEEFQRYGQIWVVFLAIPVAYRRSEHIGVDLFREWLGRRGKQRLDFVIELLWVVLGAGIMIGTLKLMPLLQFQRSPGMDLRMDLVYSVLVIGPAYLLLVACRRIAEIVRR